MNDDEAPDDITLWDRRFPEGCEIRPTSGQLGPAELDWARVAGVLCSHPS